MCPAASRLTEDRTGVLNNTPENTKRSPNDGLILDQRLRRWAKIKPTLGQRLVLAETYRLNVTLIVAGNKTSFSYVRTLWSIRLFKKKYLALSFPFLKIQVIFD